MPARPGLCACGDEGTIGTFSSPCGCRGVCTGIDPAAVGKNTDCVASSADCKTPLPPCACRTTTRGVPAGVGVAAPPGCPTTIRTGAAKRGFIEAIGVKGANDGVAAPSGALLAGATTCGGRSKGWTYCRGVATTCGAWAPVPGCSPDAGGGRPPTCTILGGGWTGEPCALTMRTSPPGAGAGCCIASRRKHLCF